MIAAQAIAGNMARRAGIVVTEADDRPRDRQHRPISATHRPVRPDARSSAALASAQNLSESQVRARISRGSLMQQPAARPGRARHAGARRAWPASMPSCCSSGGAARSASVPIGADGAGINPTEAEIAALLPAPTAPPSPMPERRVIKYAVIGPEQVSRPRAPTEAEIAAVYRNSAALYRRRARPAPSSRSCCRTSRPQPTPSRSRCAAAPRFVAAAAQAGFAAADVTFADQQPRAASRATTTPAVAAAAFAAAQGAVVGPIRSELGFHVVRVERIVADAGAAARIGARRHRPRDRAAQARRRARRAGHPARGPDRRGRQLRGGRPRRAVSPSSPRRRSPRRPAGRAASPGRRPPSSQPLLATAFEIDAEDPEPAVEPIRDNARYALLGVERVEPAAPPPLAQIRDRVRAALIQQQRAGAGARRSPTAIARADQWRHARRARLRRGAAAPASRRRRSTCAGSTSAAAAGRCRRR